MLSTSSRTYNAIVAHFKDVEFTSQMIYHQLMLEHSEGEHGGGKLSYGGIAGLLAKLVDCSAIITTGMRGRHYLYKVADADALANYPVKGGPGAGSKKGRRDGAHSRHRASAKGDTQLPLQLEDNRSEVTKLQDLLLDIADRVAKLQVDLSTIPSEDLLNELLRRNK
jgi:hypothetical protein